MINQNVVVFLAAGHLLASLFATPARAQQLDGSGQLFAPFLEWSVDNPDFSGNPFELVATARFTHLGSGDTLDAPFFYDGGTTWRLRFAATRTGTYQVLSSSADGDLDGLTGTVTIVRGTRRYGFLTQQPGTEYTSWARQTDEHGGTEAFVPQLLMFEDTPSAFADNPALIDSAIDTFLSDHGFTGFHLPSIGGYWFDIEGGRRVPEADVDPDPRTFRAIEELIIRTHEAGGVVHIWPWGDRARRWTPTELPGGINGATDERLIRYMAARFGAIAGWSMGYGFDLDEWVSDGQVKTWRQTLLSATPWAHYLGGRPEGPNSGTNHEPWRDWNSGLDYTSFEHHEPDYAVYREAADLLPDQPTFSEDRFRVRGLSGPGKDYTYEQTRQGLWASTMAGGVANIWGNLTDEAGDEISSQTSLPYPNAATLKTYARFFFDAGRYLGNELRELSPDNHPVLRSPDRSRWVIYAEDADEVMINLSGAPAGLTAVAVDARAPYAEISLGPVSSGLVTIALPRVSDWGIALGGVSLNIFSDSFEGG